MRLANVNAPEKGQRGAPQARKELRNLISRKQVNVDTVACDAYGRAVANVKVENKSVNKAMREKGRKSDLNCCQHKSWFNEAQLSMLAG